MANALNPQVRRWGDLPPLLINMIYQKIDHKLFSWVQWRIDRPISEEPCEFLPWLVECSPSPYDFGFSLGDQLRVCSVTDGRVATIETSTWEDMHFWTEGDRVFHGPGNGYLLVSSGLGIEEDFWEDVDEEEDRRRQHILVNPLTKDTLIFDDFLYDYETVMPTCNHISADNTLNLTLSTSTRECLVAVYDELSNGSWIYFENCFSSNLCYGNKLYTTQERNKMAVFEIPSRQKLFEVDPPDLEREHPVYVITRSYLDVRSTILVELDGEILRILRLANLNGEFRDFKIFKLSGVQGVDEELDWEGEDEGSEGEGEEGEGEGERGNQEGEARNEERGVGGMEVDRVDKFKGGEGERGEDEGRDGGAQLKETFDFYSAGWEGGGEDALLDDHSDDGYVGEGAVGADGDNPHWVEIQLIGNDKMVFLDKNSGFSITSQQFKGNSIYFMMEDGTSPARFDLTSRTIQLINCPFEKSTWFYPCMNNRNW